MGEFVECPYCNEEIEVELGEDDNFDITCDNCEKDFEVNVEYTPTVNAYEIVHKTCIGCNKEYRYDGKRFPRPSKFSKVELTDYFVCDTCYFKEVSEDFK